MYLKKITPLFFIVVGIATLAQAKLEELIIPEKIKIYAFYTPSHRILVDDWFLPSINNDQFEVVLECHDQECETGNYMRDGWLKTMVHKVDVIIRGIQENQGSFFIHSDVDVQFFGLTKDDIIEHMKKFDFAIQQNDPKGAGCAGFFACRANARTLNLWREVKKYMLKTNDHDQNALNHLLRENKLGISWKLLPVEYFGGGTLTEERGVPQCR